MAVLLEAPDARAAVKWIKTDSLLANWSYTSLPAVGTCRIDNSKIRMRMKLELASTRKVPDVLEVEKWLSELAETPMTIEEYADKALSEFGGKVTVWGRTATHGKIRVAMSRPSIGHI